MNANEEKRPPKNSKVIQNLGLRHFGRVQRERFAGGSVTNMHDPDTQAFVIPYGWKNETLGSGAKWRYWKPLITIWHRDPEHGGSDDSCGWFRPPLSKDLRDMIKILAADEAREPWFMAKQAKTNDDPVEVETLVRGAFLYLSRCMKHRGFLRRGVSLSEAQQWASEMTHNHVDNFRSSVCFLSGYHSNWYRDGIPNTVEEDKFWREEQARSFFGAIAGYILRERRWWFQHPKWHVWHWRLQIHPLQAFKRWAFSRCCKCGGRFSWGYSPCTHSWNGIGPRWFRSEPDVFHGNCNEPRSNGLGAATSNSVCNDVEPLDSGGAHKE